MPAVGVRETAVVRSIRNRRVRLKCFPHVSQRCVGFQSCRCISDHGLAVFVGEGSAALLRQLIALVAEALGLRVIDEAVIRQRQREALLAHPQAVVVLLAIASRETLLVQQSNAV